MKLKFASPTIPAGGTVRFVVDLASAMSIMKRRLYAQHRVWTVTGGYIVDSNNHAVATFSVAPDNWATRRAMQRVADKFFEQQREAFSLTPSSKPRWHDYRVRLLETQATGYTPTLVNPDDSKGIDFPNGEWEYSRLYKTADPGATNSDDAQIHIVGNHHESGTNMISYGAIKGWQESRPIVPNDPNISTQQETLIQEDYLNQLTDSDHTYNEIMEDSQDEMDQPPYHQENLLNETMDVASASTAPGGASIAYFPGFTALAGQVEVQLNNRSTAAGGVTVVFEVIPGGEWIDEDDV